MEEGKVKEKQWNIFPQDGTTVSFPLALHNYFFSSSSKHPGKNLGNDHGTNTCSFGRTKYRVFG